MITASDRAEISETWYRYLFESIAEVQDYEANWLWPYNHERPNTALGGIPPKQRLAMAA